MESTSTERQNIKLTADEKLARRCNHISLWSLSLIILHVCIALTLIPSYSLPLRIAWTPATMAGEFMLFSEQHVRGKKVIEDVKVLATQLYVRTIPRIYWFCCVDYILPSNLAVLGQELFRLSGAPKSYGQRYDDKQILNKKWPTQK
jgi:hypothetical protein